jgi:Arc/MetJ-type ribon-helix-helix transcriptional regulator
MKLITVYLPETYIKDLDELISEQFYPNRAEAIRVAIKQLLTEHSRFKPSVRCKIPSDERIDAANREILSCTRRSSIQIKIKEVTNP